MISEILKPLARKKNRLVLVVSAASTHSGLQYLYTKITRGRWNILQYQVVAYPQAVRAAAEAVLNGVSEKASDLGRVDAEFSQFVLENARAILSTTAPSASTPDCVIFNRLSLWKGTTGFEPYSEWNISLGEPQILASALKAPVFTDLIRHDILGGGSGMLPLGTGDLAIARQTGTITVLVNIGLRSHMSVIDAKNEKILIDSDTGPGTSLINRAAQMAGCAEGFDRDGSAGSAGKVETAILECLAGHEWFARPAPKQARENEFEILLREPSLATLAPLDVLATMTALTARTVFNFFKQNYPLRQMPDAVWVSGGGIHNLALMDYLRSYFSPIAVKSAEQLGIPPECRVLLSLALTVDALIDEKPVRNARGPVSVPLGKWVLP